MPRKRKVCSKCKLYPPRPGQAWCLACHAEYAKGQREEAKNFPVITSGITYLGNKYMLHSSERCSGEGTEMLILKFRPETSMWG